MINFIKKFCFKKENLRFPPYPNGFIHFGHVFSILINNQISKNYKGNFILRFDNTNLDFINYNNYKFIKFDILWLKIKWNNKTIFFLNNLFFFYTQLLKLNKKKYIYYKKKKIIIRFYNNYLSLSSIFNCLIFKNFFYKKYEFCFLIKNKIIFRIKKKYKNWTIFPTYDFSQSINDYINKITLSICTEEFKKNSKIYNYFIKKKKLIQIEFKKKNIKNILLSKSKNKKKDFNIFFLRKKFFRIKIFYLIANLIGVSNSNSYLKKKNVKKIIFIEKKYIKNIKINFFIKIVNLKKKIILINFFNFKNLNFYYYNMLLNNSNLNFKNKNYILKKKFFQNKKKKIYIFILFKYNVNSKKKKI